MYARYILYLLAKWKKLVLATILISLVSVAVILFIMPSLYLSVTTSLPASSFSMDKARIFNESIEELYSDIGTADDLDAVMGTAQLDTVYLAVTDQFNLFDHYQVSKNNKDARRKAAMILKDHCRVLKSDYGELKVKVWDTDKNLAPQLADAITAKLESMHQELQSGNNKATLAGLQLNQQRILARIDSLNHLATGSKNDADLNTSRQKILVDQLQQNEKLIGQYQLMLEKKPPVLMVVEKARPGLRPDKPRRVLILIATGVLSLFFALLLALALEKRKSKQS